MSVKLGEWIIEETKINLNIKHVSGRIEFRNVKPIIILGDNDRTVLDQWAVTVSQSRGVISFCHQDLLSVELHFFVDDAEPHWLKLKGILKNLFSKKINIEEFSPFLCGQIESGDVLDRFLCNGRDMCSYSTLYESNWSNKSYMMAAFSNASGSNAFVTGFVQPDDAFYHFDVKENNGSLSSLRAVCEREGIDLAPKASLDISPLILGNDASMSKLVDEYANFTATCLGYRQTPPITGWCSWYYYYNDITEKDVWNNTNAIRQSSFKDKIQLIQIDDGWNLPYKNHVNVWGDWNEGTFFSQGMKAVADRIKAEGFMPGLWLAPFSVSRDSQLYKNRPEWVIRDRHENPIACPDTGAYGLDLSKAEVVNFVRETFEKVFNQWGFEYVKIDFLFHGAMQGQRHNESQTSAALIRQGLKVIREVAKNRFILCCGCPMGPAIGITDFMRIGFDVSSRWSVKMNSDRWPDGNLNIRAAAIQTIWRQWMHRHWWQNDPDCIIVRDYGSEIERKNYRKEIPQFEHIPYGLTDEEAGFWVRLVWLTGGLAVVSENFSELDGNRSELLKHSFPPNEQHVSLADWYKSPEVAILQSYGIPKMIGVFNLGEQDIELTVPAGKFSLPERWHFHERITGERFAGSGEFIKFPAIPPHGGRIWVSHQP